MHVLVAGLGWLGEAVARDLVAAGHRVTAARRRKGDSPLFRQVACDLTDFHEVKRLPDDVEAVVVCTSARADGVEDYHAAYVEVNEALLERYADAGLAAYVYTGSTGVLGHDGGEDVDEDTPVRPSAPTAEVLVEAERLVRGAAPRVPTRVVRLSGLYGPGRAGTIERVRRGALSLGPGDDAWMNFCHRDDASAYLRAALERGEDGAVYHGSDAEPARRRDVVLWVCGRLGIPASMREDAAPGGRRGVNRRVLSEKSRRALGLTLRYPSYREGFEALLAEP
jgi:nucleoside-diphosphate-sugar epimerase